MTAFMRSLGLEWDNKVDVEGAATFLTLIFAIAAVSLTLWQLRGTARTSRADMLLRLFEIYYGQHEVRATFYKIDWGDWTYNGETIRSHEGGHVDYLLYFYDTLGYMLKQEEITIAEAEVFGFQVQRLLGNGEVQLYLADLERLYRSNQQDPPHANAYYLRDELSRHRRRFRLAR